MISGLNKVNTMNRQSAASGIEIADYTWNPVRGCKHACRWIMPDDSVVACYAETIATRFARRAYADGFDRLYWQPHLLDEPQRIETPSRIFINSMSDLMGHWVPTQRIQDVLDACACAPQHDFLLLTKYAPRLLKFSYPPNVWVGVSAPPSVMCGYTLNADQKIRWTRNAVAVLRRIDARVRWMCIEPLSFDIAPLLHDAALDWAVVGAATSGRKIYPPPHTWVADLVTTLDVQGAALFLKRSLSWPEMRREFPARAAA